MHISADTLDDLLRATFEALLKNGENVVPTKGSNRELFGVVLELNKPLARISRSELKGKLYSALGELFWYLSGSNSLSYIDYYLHRGYEAEDKTLPLDKQVIWGAYGPRLFNMRGGINQIARVRDLLTAKPASRKAIIQLFDADDLSADHADVPCTCTLQFLIRQAGLDMFVSMRSNDAYKGLPHDIFAFTMLQELLARDLGVPLGRYKHAAGSLHLYDDDEQKARDFLNEGWQDIVEMPPMPKGSQWKAVETLKSVEECIRLGKDVDVGALGLDNYWADLVRILCIYRLTRGTEAAANKGEAENIAKAMSSDYFRPYVRDRRKKADKKSGK
jgi:thymidylate synthase